MSERRKLPRVDTLSERSSLARYPRELRVKAARAALERLRQEMPSGDLEALAEDYAEQEALARSRPSIGPILNASGVILHTGLGRARLAKAAVESMLKVAESHANLEIDLETGKRGDRQHHVRSLLVELTGASEVFVVQNCAAAVFLALQALAYKKEVLLSRGQMVEIGGSFRLPDIVRQSGCKLVDVGTTNKTRLQDYENAVTAKTAAVLRCHPSNYQVVGFTEDPSIQELAAFCDERDLKLIDDVGSGCLVDTTSFGLPKAPTLQDAVSAGADVVMGSGDKLLGGPQSGIILGKAESINRMKKHPLARAFRIDKFSLAALEATLRLYANGQSEEIPTLRYLRRSLEEVKSYATQLQQAYGEGAILEPGITEIGGGSLPGSGVPTVRVGIKTPKPDALAKRLRMGAPPMLTRVERNSVWLDPRTLDVEEMAIAESLLRGAR